MLRQALICLAFVWAFVLASSTARSPSAWADTPADAGVVDAGSAAGSAAASTDEAVKPDATVTNPAQHPVQALDEVKLAKKTSWPLALWLGLVMLGKALAYGRDKLAKVPLVGKLATWLAKGKGAMLVAAIGAIGAAGYNTVIDGGTWVAGLVAAGAALGGVLHSTTKTTGGAPATDPPG